MSGGLDRVRSVVASCGAKTHYTANYVLRQAAVEFTLKMSLQKVRDELIYCFADEILNEEELVLLYHAYKLTNSIYRYPYREYDEFSLDARSSPNISKTAKMSISLSRNNINPLFLLV